MDLNCVPCPYSHSECGPPPLVAIIGRPNVGKSTLFNKILGAKIAIVDDVPGVTRDRNYADATYRNRKFRLVDTGGLDLSASDSMLTLIRRQSELAIAEADILIMLLDGRSGLTPPDQEVVRLLRGVTKPLFYAINKIDTPKSDPLLADFYRLGSRPAVSLCLPNMASGSLNYWMPSIRSFRLLTSPMSSSTSPRGRGGTSERRQIHPRECTPWRGTGRRQQCSGNDTRSGRLTGHA